MPNTQISRITKNRYETVSPLPIRRTGQGELTLAVASNQLPSVLIQAHQRTNQGDKAGARELLDENTLASLQALGQQDPVQDAMIHFLLGQIMQSLGDSENAVRHYEAALKIGDQVDILRELVNIHQGVGHYSMAMDFCQRARQLAPDRIDLIGDMAILLAQLRRPAEAAALLEPLIEVGRITPAYHSQYLWHLNYDVSLDRQTLYKACQRWGQLHAHSPDRISPHTNDRSTTRCLRIGYVSPDFRQNSANYTFELLLDGCHVTNLKLYGYGHVHKPDDTTVRLREKFYQYRDITSLNDQVLAEQIRQDGIDILVAMPGHTTDNRLTVFARRPAPVQVDMGSIHTVGLPQIDYRLTDTIIDPSEDQRFYMEQLVPIERGYFSYRPPEEAPPVGPLPAIDNGYVTFGSFANHMKINDMILGLWSQILNRIPSARLMLKCPGGRDPVVRNSILNCLYRNGVAPERINLIGWVEKQSHFELYNQVDVSLDTYPFNGGLTILEGLWMGVPTISLQGPHHVSHVAASLLSRVGLGMLACQEPDHMVAKAEYLATHLDYLVKMRAQSRSAMQASVLCDAERFARDTETAFRFMWKQWCTNPNMRGGRPV